MRIYPIKANSDNSKSIMSYLNVSSEGINIMDKRFSYSTFIVEDIHPAGANALKQELLYLGGEAAVSKGSITCKDKRVAAMFSICDDKLPALISSLKMQYWKLKDIALFLEDQIKSKSPWYNFDKQNIPDSPVVMGILNTTPDSFSDGGEFYAKEDAVKRAKLMIEQGAAIIDVGGESTRPGSVTVPVDVELSRTIPVIRDIRKLDENILISIDTTKYEVAKKALEAGADIINDISGLIKAPRLADLAKEYHSYMVLMHMQGTPLDMQENPDYDGRFLASLLDFFKRAIDQALASGVDEKRIIIDPGIGFGKKVRHNISILKNLNSFSAFNIPVLVGVSRKSYINALCKRENPADREAATVASNMIALQNGAAIVRVHNVEGAVDTIKIFNALSENRCY